MFSYLWMPNSRLGLWGKLRKISNYAQEYLTQISRDLSISSRRFNPLIQKHQRIGCILRLKGEQNSVSFGCTHSILVEAILLYPCHHVCGNWDLPQFSDADILASNDSCWLVGHFSAVG